MNDKNKEIYETELKKVWSQKMVNYCLKEADIILNTNQGLFVIDKPTIQKDFYFGYDNSIESYNNAKSLTLYAEKNTEYFIKENLKELNEKLKILKDDKKVIYINSYKKTNIKLWAVDDSWGFKNEVLNDKNRSLLVEAYENELERFSKRLDTYLKKYGFSNIKTKTYWID